MQRQAPRGDEGDGLTGAERELAQRLRARLRDSEQSLDAVTLARLSAARRRALAARPSRRGAWLALGGVASAAALSLLIAIGLPRPASDLPDLGVPAGEETAGADSLDNLDVLTDDNDPDFYEDLNLYRWLAEEPAAAGDTPRA